MTSTNLASNPQTYAVSTTPVKVIAVTWCERVVVQENYDSANPPTADLRQYGPGQSGPIAIPKGTPAIFTTLGGYFPGQEVGWIATASGSITVQQNESIEV